MKTFLSKYTFPLLGVIGAVAVSAAVFAAWTEPTQTPPGGNLSAPLTVSSVAQFKEGALALGQNTLPTSGSILDVKGTVSSKGLLVNGVVAIIDGSQGNGKVLTSAADGTAQWKNASSSGTVCGSYRYWSTRRVEDTYAVKNDHNMGCVNTSGFKPSGIYDTAPDTGATYLNVNLCSAGKIDVMTGTTGDSYTSYHVCLNP